MLDFWLWGVAPIGLIGLAGYAWLYIGTHGWQNVRYIYKPHPMPGQRYMVPGCGLVLIIKCKEVSWDDDVIHYKTNGRLCTTTFGAFWASNPTLVTTEEEEVMKVVQEMRGEK